jgi:aspartyl-tRNA(Asn)/glutamyl-tRNA(Gln) amidotransferase subunit C
MATPGVTVQDVRHIAMLAKLGVTEQRAEELAKDLNTILEHMAVLSQVQAKGTDDAAIVGADGMRLRPDRGPAIPLGEPPAAFGPATRDGFFIVPRLSTHDDLPGAAGESP